jgi:hypothetical protein
MPRRAEAVRPRTTRIKRSAAAAGVPAASTKIHAPGLTSAAAISGRPAWGRRGPREKRSARATSGHRVRQRATGARGAASLPALHAVTGHGAGNPPGRRGATGHGATSRLGRRGVTGPGAASPRGRRAPTGRGATSRRVRREATSHGAPNPRGRHAATGHGATSRLGRREVTGHGAASPQGRRAVSGRGATSRRVCREATDRGPRRAEATARGRIGRQEGSPGARTAARRAARNLAGSETPTVRRLPSRNGVRKPDATRTVPTSRRRPSRLSQSRSRPSGDNYSPM